MFGTNSTFSFLSKFALQTYLFSILEFLKNRNKGEARSLEERPLTTCIYYCFSTVVYETAAWKSTRKLIFFYRKLPIGDLWHDYL